MARPISSGWTRYGFDPTTPTQLGFSRLVYLAGVLCISATQDTSAWARVDPAFWMPMTFFDLFDIPVASEPTLRVMDIVWKVALALGCVGLFTRSSLAVSALLGFYLLGLPHNFGKIHHYEAACVLILGILAVSRCGDAWSLDSIIAASRNRDRPRIESGEYRWPIRLVWVLIALVLFAAGYAKISRSGLEWVTSDNMRTLILQHQYYYGGIAPTELGLLIAQHPGLCKAIAAMTILMELGFGLALFSRYLRWVLVPSAVAMLIGFWLILGPFFPLLIWSFVFFVSWDWVGRRIRLLIGRPDASFCSDTIVCKEEPR